ncbi:MAG: hypothetical protein AB1502_12405 [Thermodesulfobacteriota bacterium]
MSRAIMGMRIKRSSFVLLLFSWNLLNTGCSYLVKNERNQIYSKSKFGEDKFVVVKKVIIFIMWR